MNDDDIDPEMELIAREDEQRVYAGPGLFDCPDCGAHKALTAEMKRRGYHCDRCTRCMESGVDE